MAERGERLSSSSREVSSSPATSLPSRSEHVHEEEDDERGAIEPEGGDFRQPELEQQQIGIIYRGNFTVSDDTTAALQDDTWSCIIVALTFWFFGLQPSLTCLSYYLGISGSSVKIRHLIRRLRC